MQRDGGSYHVTVHPPRTAPPPQWPRRASLRYPSLPASSERLHALLRVEAGVRGGFEVATMTRCEIPPNPDA